MRLVLAFDSVDQGPSALNDVDDLVEKLLAKCRVHALHWRSLCDTSPLPRAIVDRLPSLVTPHPACTALGGGAEGAPNGCEHDT